MWTVHPTHRRWLPVPLSKLYNEESTDCLVYYVRVQRVSLYIIMNIVSVIFLYILGYSNYESLAAQR